MKYRPSKSFAIAMAGLCPLLVALIFGLLPEVESMRKPPLRGEIEFSKDRPVFKTNGSISKVKGSASPWSMDWFEQSYENLMTWDKNPWKTERQIFGYHYFEMLSSKDPFDVARAKELRRLGEALHQRLTQRYPELAVPYGNVPPERNGLLKWLEFADRFSIDPADPAKKRYCVGISDELQRSLSGNGAWDADAARSWLIKEKATMDQIREIGLMPEQSIAGIETDRWAGFNSIRLPLTCAQALMIESRLAAGNGDIPAALSAIQAARGIGAHFGDVETPSLLATCTQLEIDHELRSFVLSEIMPAVPSGQLDPAAWEKALNPKVSQPDDYSRIMRGEWNAVTREFLTPMVSDTADPKYPPDPEALMDYYSETILRIVRSHEGIALTDLQTVQLSSAIPDNSHLSRQSRLLTEMLFQGLPGCRKGWDRAQSAAAMTQAAFAIMKGQPIPNDPVYGLPYQWNPATRELSAPDSPAFKNMDIKPIKVPKP